MSLRAAARTTAGAADASARWPPARAWQGGGRTDVGRGHAGNELRHAATTTHASMQHQQGLYAPVHAPAQPKTGRCSRGGCRPPHPPPPHGGPMLGASWRSGGRGGVPSTSWPAAPVQQPGAVIGTAVSAQSPEGRHLRQARPAATGPQRARCPGTLVPWRRRPAHLGPRPRLTSMPLCSVVCRAESIGGLAAPSDERRPRSECAS